MLQQYIYQRGCLNFCYFLRTQQVSHQICSLLTIKIQQTNILISLSQLFWTLTKPMFSWMRNTYILDKSNRPMLLLISKSPSFSLLKILCLSQYLQITILKIPTVLPGSDLSSLHHHKITILTCLLKSLIRQPTLTQDNSKSKKLTLKLQNSTAITMLSVKVKLLMVKWSSVQEVAPTVIVLPASQVLSTIPALKVVLPALQVVSNAIPLY